MTKLIRRRSKQCASWRARYCWAKAPYCSVLSVSSWQVHVVVVVVAVAVAVVVSVLVVAVVVVVIVLAIPQEVAEVVAVLSEGQALCFTSGLCRVSCPWHRADRAGSRNASGLCGRLPSMPVGHSAVVWPLQSFVMRAHCNSMFASHCCLVGPVVFMLSSTLVQRH